MLLNKTDTTMVILDNCKFGIKSFLWKKLNNTEIIHYKVEEDNLIAYYDFNEGLGDVLTDLSGNGNDGIIVGAEWSIDVA